MTSTSTELSMSLSTSPLKSANPSHKSPLTGSCDDPLCPRSSSALETNTNFATTWEQWVGNYPPNTSADSTSSAIAHPLIRTFHTTAKKGLPASTHPSLRSRIGVVNQNKPTITGQIKGVLHSALRTHWCRLALLNDHQRVAVEIPEPEHRRNRVAHTGNLGIDIHPGRSEL